MSLILIVILLKTVLNIVAREHFENTNQMNYMTSMSFPVIKVEAEVLTVLERHFMITLHIIYLDLFLRPLLLACSFPNNLYSLVLGVEKKKNTVADIFTCYSHCLNCRSLPYLHYSSILVYRSFLKYHLLHFSWASQIAQLVKNLPAMQETLVQFLGGGDLLEKG